MSLKDQAILGMLACMGAFEDLNLPAQPKVKERKYDLNDEELELLATMTPKQKKQFFKERTMKEQEAKRPIDRKWIAIDFDGTMVEHNFPMIGKPIPYAIEVIKELQKEGHLLILYTMRSGLTLDDAKKYATDNGINFDGFNTNPGQNEWTNSNKAYAHIYIDDAALGAPLIYPMEGRPFVDWRQVSTLLVRMGALRKNEYCYGELV